MYRHDYAGTGYSPLAQINTKNVPSLREVWSYRLQGDTPNSQVTPIVVNGSMYLPAGNRSWRSTPKPAQSAGGTSSRTSCRLAAASRTGPVKLERLASSSRPVAG